MLTSGKLLREDIPPDALSEDELIDFWADEQMQNPELRSPDPP